MHPLPPHRGGSNTASRPGVASAGAAVDEAEAEYIAVLRAGRASSPVLIAGPGSMPHDAFRPRVSLPLLGPAAPPRSDGGGDQKSVAESRHPGAQRAVWTSGSPYLPRRIADEQSDHHHRAAEGYSYPERGGGGGDQPAVSDQHLQPSQQGVAGSRHGRQPAAGLAYAPHSNSAHQYTSENTQMHAHGLRGDAPPVHDDAARSQLAWQPLPVQHSPRPPPPRDSSAHTPQHLRSPHRAWRNHQPVFSGDANAVGASEYGGFGDGGRADDDAQEGRFPRERRRVGDDDDDLRGGGGGGDGGSSDLHSSVRLAEIGAALDSQVSHYRAECHELRVSRDALLRTNAALHARVEADARLAAELDEERGMRTAAERALAVARAQIDAQTSLARELQSANNALEGTKEELTALASTVAAERDQLHTDLTSAREDVVRLSSQLDAQTVDATGNTAHWAYFFSHTNWVDHRRGFFFHKQDVSKCSAVNVSLATFCSKHHLSSSLR